ncbi:MAG: hypothetical protein MUO67_21630 [Anaerolineales bacterium]|nr:hypothetical protein [Anaerolineales bacterium]
MLVNAHLSTPHPEGFREQHGMGVRYLGNLDVCTFNHAVRGVVSGGDEANALGFIGIAVGFLSEQGDAVSGRFRGGNNSIAHGWSPLICGVMKYETSDVVGEPNEPKEP